MQLLEADQYGMFEANAEIDTNKWYINNRD